MKHPRTPSLRRRLVFISLITTGLALMLSNIAFMALEYYLSEQDNAKKLTVLSNVIASRSTAALAFSDQALLMSNLEALQADSSIIRACVYNDKRQLSAFYPRQNQQACPLNQDDLQRLYRNSLPVETDILFNNRAIGYLYIESNRADLIARFQTFIVFSVIIFIVGFLLSRLLATRLKNLIVSPLQKLGTTLSQIIHNRDFSLRAPKHSGDELGTLVDLFNDLLQVIEDDNLALKASEERFRKLTALSPVGIFQIDALQNLVYTNDRWRDIHNIAEEHPSLSRWFERIHPQDADMLSHVWQHMITTKESITVEFRVQRNDGSHLWIHLLASALHSSDGELIGYLGATSDISELKAAQLQMENLAFYDPLTGLANRRLFKNRLEKSVKTVLRNGSSTALMFLDMDQFKRINDTLGHDAGDVLLKEVAKRLAATVRENDTVSRIGGDEFTILLTDVHHASDVQVVAEKLLHAMSKPIRIKGQDIITTVSIGITLTPDDSTDANTLMKNADLAMYRAKEMGRNTFQFYSDEMNHTILEHLALEKELKEAIAREQFSLVFQPKISLLDQSVTGVETLIRWQHPEKGMITPDRFIPIAEETGLILDIGAWVLEQSCRQISTLMREALLPSTAKVAVNLSAKQFSDPRLMQHIQYVLDVSGIPAQCLELEITESTLMDDVEIAIRIMQEIKALGVSIAIDDFGTGYSSLSYIKRFPINVLKVDRSFVMDIPTDENDMAITAAVIAMAHKLSLSVVAEGVETQQQWDFLRDNQCDEGQGYFLSRPLSLAQLHQFLQDHRAIAGKP